MRTEAQRRTGIWDDTTWPADVQPEALGAVMVADPMDEDPQNPAAFRMRAFGRTFGGKR